MGFLSQPAAVSFAPQARTGAAERGTHPSHDLKDYAGDYENPGYGLIKVQQEGDALELAINKLGLTRSPTTITMFSRFRKTPTLPRLANSFSST